MIAMGFILIIAVIVAILNKDAWQVPQAPQGKPTGDAAAMLSTLAVKGRAPKTGYARAQFGDGWAESGGCDMRNKILYRDLTDTTVNDKCQVERGTLSDPYTGKTIAFVRGASTSDAIQIDHVVALGDAWQKGAQQLTAAEREQLANDPLELLAVDGKTNQQKSDGDAATWLPPNKPFRCQYVARQIAVKQKYRLWVTQAEHDAMEQVLSVCPGQSLPKAN
jgi:hypothetical protein